MRLFAGLVACSCLMVLTTCSAKKEVQFKPAAASKLQIKETRKIQPRTAGDVFHWRRFYAPWTCDVDWEHRCEGTEIIEADEDFMACRLEVLETTHDGWDPWFGSDPVQFYTNDPQSPDRFRAYRATIHAFGNGNWVDRRGSKEVVEITFDMVSVSLTRDQRFAAGCYMPVHD